MNNEQIKQRINFASEKRKLAESFLLPLLAGEVAAFISYNQTHEGLYKWLLITGAISFIVIALIIRNLNAEIQSLINHLS